MPPGIRWPGAQVDSTGVFSLAIRPGRSIDTSVHRRRRRRLSTTELERAEQQPGSTDGGVHWKLATTPPHGYRSAVAYDSNSKTWITVGPNGTDISTDDGRNWRALKPDPKFNDPPDADQHWNALSLPYAVGPHGRIATLRPSALPSSK